MAELSPRAVLPIIRLALAEDCARQDITSRTIIPAKLRLKAQIIAKSPGVAAGVEVAKLTFKTLDASLRCHQHVRSGAAVKPGTVILTVEGKARSIFAAERTALNFIMHLSGIATFTRQFVQRVHGTGAKILDTRKTLPGLRTLEKYAVRMGGGVSHRGGLHDAILIKTNHLRALEKLSFLSVFREAASYMIARQVLAKAKAIRPKRLVIMEATSVSEFSNAYGKNPADVVLMDNCSLKEIRQAVAGRRAMAGLWGPIEIEVSGGVTLANVRAIAKTGVDRISIGRLTHSAPSLDVSLRVL